MNEYYRNLLQKNGWAETNFDSLDFLKEKIYSFSLSFGKPKPSRKSQTIVQELKPIKTTDARLNTLSRVYSDTYFPLHIDTAHWIVPSRFCFIVCANPGIGNRKTILLDSHDIELSPFENELLNQALFKVINGKNSFVSTVLSNDRKFIRYDPGCMIPVDKKGKLVNEILNYYRWKNKIIDFEWEAGKVLIIDNWRMLHGRSITDIDDNNRTLYRVLTI